MKHALRTALALALPAMLAAGCARTVVVEPQATSYDPNDVTAQLDFWHEMPGRSAITNDEGMHGVILLVWGTDDTGSYENRVAFLRERGWLPAGVGEGDQNVAMQRGTLSTLLVNALGIEGGVMMQLTNASPRYAYRELVYRGIMPQGSEQMVLDGLDFVGVVSKAEDFMRMEEVIELREIEEAAPAPTQGEPAPAAEEPAEQVS